MGISSTVAKENDRSIQINFTIPQSLIESEIDKLVEKESKELEVPGFRKGKAPKHIVRKNLSEDKLLSQALSNILPNAFYSVIKEHNIKVVMYPKFEVVGKKDSVIEVKAVTCEAPEIQLGDYKDLIRNSKKADIWVPGKDRTKKEPTREQKESQVIRILLEKYKDIQVPRVLLEEEVNIKLSALLSRLEKLGLTLEGYLQSIGKTAESLRNEYLESVKSSIILDFILSEIALKEDIKIDSSEAKEFFKSVNPEVVDKPEEKQLTGIIQILKKRKALEKLSSLL